MEIEQIEEQLALDQAKLRLTREQLQQLTRQEAKEAAVVNAWIEILKSRGKTDHGASPSEAWSGRHNLTSQAVALVRQAGEKGATPRELRGEARRQGLRTHSQWPYAELTRNVAKGLLISKDGRYYDARYCGDAKP